MLRNVIQNGSFQNAFWSVLEVIIYPLVLLLATPFFIEKLGVEMYGLWMLINGSLAFLDILGFGVNETLIKFISAYVVKDQHQKIIDLVATLFPILLLSVIVGISAGVLFYVVKPGVSFLDVPIELYDLFAFVIPIAFVGLTLKMVEQFFLSFLRGMEGMI
ncbi:hypothetical protein KFE98_04415 [bacterium SCSIO 12741]|nr:hypothetical protein KFE98_04415 [bacterium SCSIO 12741]